MSKKKWEMPPPKKAETLQKRKPYTISFEHCDEDNIPIDKTDVKIVIKALKSFSDIQLFDSRRKHKLDPAGRSEYIKSLYKQHREDLYSIDAGKAGGKQGSKRIIFYHDPILENVVKILSLFFDDHGKR